MYVDLYDTIYIVIISLELQLIIFAIMRVSLQTS